MPTDKLQIYFAEAWSIEEYENQVQRLEKAGKARVQGGLDNIVLNMLRYAEEHLSIYKRLNDRPLRDIPVD